MKISWRVLHGVSLAFVLGAMVLCSGCGGGGGNETGSVDAEAKARMEKEHEQSRNAWEQTKQQQNSNTP